MPEQMVHPDLPDVTITVPDRGVEQWKKSGWELAPKTAGKRTSKPRTSKPRTRTRKPGGAPANSDSTNEPKES